MTKILVTGSSGFIGEKVVKKIKKTDLISDKKKSKKIDLKNYHDVMKIKPADIVIHLAGKTQKNLNSKDYFENNFISTLNILEYCITKKIKKIIYVSSYVYGKPKYLPIDENHPVFPHNEYAKSKFLAEELCKYYAQKFGLKVIILRPFNIYGKGLQNNYLIKNIFDSLKNNKKIIIENKNSKRDFLFIDDFVEIILRIKDYDCNFEIFNVGYGQSVSFTELIKKIEKITSQKISFVEKKNNQTYIREITCDITKMKKKLKWNPRIDIEEGLRNMYY